MNVRTKFEVLRFTRSWDNRGYTWDNRGYLKTLCSPWIRPRSLFSQIFNGLLFGWNLWIYRPILKYVALPVPEIIAIEFLRVANSQSWGRGGRMGSGFERALLISYRPSRVTYPLSLRVSEILPLLCSSRPLFRTQPLVSPEKFPHVCPGVAGWLFGYEERRCWANCPCN